MLRFACFTGNFGFSVVNELEGGETQARRPIRRYVVITRELAVARNRADREAHLESNGPCPALDWMGGRGWGT